jgi:hypothetical protein
MMKIMNIAINDMGKIELTYTVKSNPGTLKRSPRLSPMVGNLPGTSERLSPMVGTLPGTSERLSPMVGNLPGTSERLSPMVGNLPGTSERLSYGLGNLLFPPFRLIP